MNLQKSIIIITLTTVGLCGALLIMENFRSSNTSKTAVSKSDITDSPVANLNLAEPPASLEMTNVQNPSENSNQSLSTKEYIPPQTYNYDQSNDENPTPRNIQVYATQDNSPQKTEPKIETQETSSSTTTTQADIYPQEEPLDNPEQEDEDDDDVFFLPDGF